MSQWGPIESAPKDTRVLIVTNGYFVGEGFNIAGSRAKGWQWASGRVCGSMPTHWMPLPEPPK